MSMKEKSNSPRSVVFFVAVAVAVASLGVWADTIRTPEIHSELDPHSLFNEGDSFICKESTVYLVEAARDAIRAQTILAQCRLEHGAGQCDSAFQSLLGSREVLADAQDQIDASC